MDIASPLAVSAQTNKVDNLLMTRKDPIMYKAFFD
jgi:hypothetical protein